jgi:rhomboid protease GluP
MGDHQETIGDLRANLPAGSLLKAYSLPSSTTWATVLIIAINVVVFVAMAATSGSIWAFDPNTLAAWGGNSGSLDLSGQWWRLLTYQFVHINILHIAINMWVLWSVGRLVEKLFGSFSLLFIYLASGTFAGLVSIGWIPDQVSVGASGSIFGLLGALVVFLSFFRNDVPLWALRYWVPASIFVLVSLVGGATQPNVDNAAHIGGLIAGLIIGATTIRPADRRHPLPLQRSAIAAIAISGFAVALLWYVGALQYRSSALDEFASTHRWYLSGEAQNLRLWQTLGTQAASQTVSQDELAKRFQTDILPFWNDASARLGKEAERSGDKGNPMVPLVAEFARLRFEWAKAVIAAQDNAPEHIQEALDDLRKTNVVQAKMDRLKLLIAAGNMPRPLYDNAPVNWVMGHVLGHAWACVEAPQAFEKSVGATDSTSDGPYQRHAEGCLAQQLFMTGDYAALDAEVRKYSANLADLPDGSSHYEGVWSGLDTLFSYGRISVTEALRRAALWKRSVKDSAEPSLVEALIFRDWAYGARGYGIASSVSGTAMATYLARAEMSAESLRVINPRERRPEWYTLSLGVDRDLSIPSDDQRATFDEGNARYRAYFPPYRQMLVSLMPRWGGSTELVDNFILAVSMEPGSGQVDPALYARLYLTYGNLERGDFNVVEAAKADPALMKSGLEAYRKRYPNSDYVLNAVTRFACTDNDVFAYRALRKTMQNRVSLTAWPDALSVASCDKWSN